MHDAFLDFFLSKLGTGTTIHWSKHPNDWVPTAKICVSNYSKSFLDCGRNLKNPEEIYTDMGRTYKVHK